MSSTLLAIREMQSKTTVRYHQTPTRMAKRRNSDNTKCWRENAEKDVGSFTHCWWEAKWYQHSRKEGSLQNETSAYRYDPAISLWAFIPEMKLSHVHTKTCIPIFISALLINKSILEITQKSFSGWLAKQTMLHSYHGIPHSHPKKWTIDHAMIWMDLKEMVLSGKKKKKSQSQKYTDHTIPFI